MDVTLATTSSSPHRLGRMITCHVIAGLLPHVHYEDVAA